MEDQAASGSGASYQEGFVKVNGIQLHYLDWGGPGQPLMMVHAWGDSPYLFLDLASALSRDFRVITYSGRGHGKSDVPDWGYDVANLTEDLKQLLDCLAITHVNLLGTSSAGNEITEFATSYPESTKALIYVEAGYDLSHELASDALKSFPVAPIPDSDALSSIDSYREWVHNFWYADAEWQELLELNLRASTKIRSDGSVQTIPDDGTLQLLLQSHSAYHREYHKIKAPVLALFAPEFLTNSSADPNLKGAYAKWNHEKVRPWKQHSINRLKTELQNVTLKEIPATCHLSIIFKNTKVLAETISNFLKNI